MRFLLAFALILSINNAKLCEGNFSKLDLIDCKFAPGNIWNIISDTAKQFSYVFIVYGNDTRSSCSEGPCPCSIDCELIRKYTTECGIQIALINSSVFADLSNTLLSFRNPEIVFLIPVNEENEKHQQSFNAAIKQIAKTLNSDLNPWTTWTSLFFIRWPTSIEVEFGNNTNLTEEVKTDILRNIISSTNVSFPLDSEVFMIVSTSTEVVKENLVFEMYTQMETLVVQQVVLPISGTEVFSNYLCKSKRRENFNLAQIRAVAYSDPDYNLQIKFKRSMNTNNVAFESGVSLSIFLALEFALNFSHAAVNSDGWLEQLENGTWIGMGKPLMENRADISISFSMSLPERLKGFDFLHAVSYGSIKAFFRQPDINTIRDIFIIPFQNEMWFCLLFFWMVVICTLRGIHVFRESKNLNIDSHDSIVVNESMLWVVSTVCLKGWHITPSSISMKIIFACGSFTGFIYFTAYSASLVSTLSVEVTPIDTIIQLAQSQLELLGDFWLPNSPAIIQELEIEKIKQYASYSKPIKEKQFIEIDHAIPKLLSSPSAFLTFSDGFLTVFRRFNLTDNFFCDTFSAISVSKAPLCSGYIVKKGSHYKEFFNAKILMIQERGISFRNNRIYFRGTSASCPRKTNNYGNDLGLVDLFTAHLILFGGIGVSLILIFMENILVLLMNYA